MIDDCSFCRCRGISCVQGVKMVDDCLFCRCRGHSCVLGVLLGMNTRKTTTSTKRTIIYLPNRTP
jgi:hypothetical protein